MTRITRRKTTKKPKINLSSLKDYKPLIIIVIFCIILPFVLIQPFDFEDGMYLFMGFFFTFLSLFKFFDLQGFVNGFESYDLVTKAVRPYGYCYPFIELFLGLSYLGGFNLPIVNWITLAVMIISGLGVTRSVMNGKQMKCACLGTTLSVPLTTVSIVENLGMGLMAAYKLL